MKTKIFNYPKYDFRDRSHIWELCFHETSTNMDWGDVKILDKTHKKTQFLISYKKDNIITSTERNGIGKDGYLHWISKQGGNLAYCEPGDVVSVDDKFIGLVKSEVKLDTIEFNIFIPNYVIENKDYWNKHSIERNMDISISRKCRLATDEEISKFKEVIARALCLEFDETTGTLTPIPLQVILSDAQFEKAKKDYERVKNKYLRMKEIFEPDE